MKLSEEKCFSEPYEIDTLLTGYFKLFKGSSVISMIIYDPHKKVLFQKNGVTESKFAVQLEKSGDYKFCFTSRRQIYSTTFGGMLKIELEIRGDRSQNEMSPELETESVNPIEKEIIQMEQMVKQIKKYLDYSKEREEAMRDTSESTNARVLWFLILSLCILFAKKGSCFFQMNSYLQIFTLFLIFFFAAHCDQTEETIYESKRKRLFLGDLKETEEVQGFTFTDYWDSSVISAFIISVFLLVVLFIIICCLFKLQTPKRTFKPTRGKKDD
ncbi:transmembrane emp24 domain-containing protein [Anaeramoeba flamelloides]|uniref:Transmembrane emp24 domain-containing protein n=1 Tax=Anaeramoeba flamelloides TaxID=1746091 RepID=A0ABQ8XWF1_9EUKA|nr:transmembrane emp24 domain-containing protein [Anaeramoeba flamelloides]